MEFLKAMGFRTYLKEKQHRALSKYNHLQKKVASKFFLLQDRVLSRLHYQSRKDSVVFHANNNGVQPKYDSIDFLPYNEPQVFKKEEIMESSIDAYTNDDLNLQIPENSRVIRIIVIKGKIIEKEYLKTTGEKVTLNF